MDVPRVFTCPTCGHDVLVPLKPWGNELIGQVSWEYARVVICPSCREELQVLREAS